MSGRWCSGEDRVGGAGEPAGAAAVAGASVAYNLASSSNGRFGAADHLLTYGGADPRTQARVAAAGEWFGTIDVIGRRLVPVPGSVESVEFRAQDPQGAYSAPMLALRESRWPTGADQVAVTDAVASTFQLGVGDPLALDGHHRTVVGLVENPSDLGSLSRVPVLDLTVTAVGLPLLAALAGWLLAGREPPSIARQPLQ